MTTEAIFTLAEALAVQKALREAAGAKEETFDLADVIAMASDEIEMLQEAGKSTAAIAAMIQTVIGKPVTAGDVEDNYVGPEDREWDDDEFDEDQAKR
ncbi:MULTISPECIES: hypothetical protein [Rhodomicrobium]|uniref:hypothetical protein n=1 Tax=Rhodomicrobium TaxID=1068 RepID=UPI000B4A5628|nr:MULTISPECIES: hypothetical protein [Rhodomicrobium]